MALESIIPVPDVMQAKRVLAVQPHYDDNDIAAGGTLAALHAAGAEIVYLTVTDDLMGVIDASLSPGAAAAQLKREQEAAGKIIGVSQHYWLGYPDAGKSVLLSTIPANRTQPLTSAIRAKRKNRPCDVTRRSSRPMIWLN